MDQQETVSADVATTYQYAGFGRRLLSALIDGIVIALVGAAVAFVLSQGQSTVLQGAPAVILQAAYVILLWVNMGGQTLGKKVMGIKVIKSDGTPIDYVTAIIRYLGYMLSALPLGLGYLWVIWDKNKQGFHDKIANTYVVKA